MVRVPCLPTGLLQIGVELVEHDEQGREVVAVGLSHLLGVKVVDVAHTVFVTDAHPFMHLMFRPCDRRLRLAHLIHADIRQRVGFRPLGEIHAAFRRVDENDLSAAQHRLGHDRHQRGRFAGAGLAADHQMRGAFQREGHGVAEIIDPHEERACIRCFDGLPIGVDLEGERALLGEQHVEPARAMLVTTGQHAPIHVIRFGQELVKIVLGSFHADAARHLEPGEQHMIIVFQRPQPCHGRVASFGIVDASHAPRVRQGDLNEFLLHGAAFPLMDVGDVQRGVVSGQPDDAGIGGAPIQIGVLGANGRDDVRGAFADIGHGAASIHVQADAP